MADQQQQAAAAPREEKMDDEDMPAAQQPASSAEGDLFRFNRSGALEQSHAQLGHAVSDATFSGSGDASTQSDFHSRMMQAALPLIFGGGEDAPAAARAAFEALPSAALSDHPNEWRNRHGILMRSVAAPAAARAAFEALPAAAVNWHMEQDPPPEADPDSDEDDMIAHDLVEQLEALERANVAVRARAEAAQKTRNDLSALMNEVERDLPRARERVVRFIQAVTPQMVRCACIVEVTVRNYDWFTLKNAVNTIKSMSDALCVVELWICEFDVSDRDRLSFLALALLRFGFQSRLVSALLPYFHTWPCQSSRNAMLTLLRDIDKAEGPQHKFHTLAHIVNQFRWMHIPRITRDIDFDFISTFMLPILSFVPDDGSRRIAFEQWICSMRDSVVRFPEVAARRLTDAFPFTDLPNLFRMHNEGVNYRRGHSLDSAYEKVSQIKDEAAPADTPGTCLACTVNFRRVCQIPCGHIDLCGACTIEVMHEANNRGTLVKCSSCRAVVALWQPCYASNLVESVASAAASQPCAPASAAAAVSNQS